MERLWSCMFFYILKNNSRDMNNDISICPLYSIHFKHTFQNYITPADFILLEALADAKNHFK